MARRWSFSAKQALIDGAGYFGLVWYKRRSNPPGDYFGAQRSRAAIYAAAGRLYSGGFTRGARTLREACEETGYARSQFFRARQACAQKWRRLSPKGPFLIGEEQFHELIAWLAHDYWAASKRLYCCVGCQTTTRQHRSLGLCDPCYHRYRRRCLAAGIPVDPAKQAIWLVGLADDSPGKREAQRLAKKRVALPWGFLRWIKKTVTKA